MQPRADDVGPRWACRVNRQAIADTMRVDDRSVRSSRAVLTRSLAPQPCRKGRTPRHPKEARGWTTERGAFAVQVSIEPIEVMDGHGEGPGRGTHGRESSVMAVDATSTPEPPDSSARRASAAFSRLVVVTTSGSGYATAVLARRGSARMALAWSGLEAAGSGLPG